MSKLRWTKNWWGDEYNDPALQQCSLAAQGAWRRLLCVAALLSERYGYLMIGDRPATDRELAGLVKRRLSVTRFRRLLAELLRHKLIARSDDKSVLFAPILVTSLYRFETQSRKGTKSWEARKRRASEENGSNQYHDAVQTVVQTRSRKELPQKVIPFCVPEDASEKRASRSDGARAFPSRPPEANPTLTEDEKIQRLHDMAKRLT